MNNIRHRLHEQLEKRQIQGNIRSLNLKSGLIDFSSNDYLGLARNRELSALIKDNLDQFEPDNGSTGSRLLTGNSSLHLELEEQLAEFFRAPAALLFNSGYTANLALISTIPQRGDTIVYDQAIHACVKDGARLSNAKCLSFKHNDPIDLKKKLRFSSGNKFVVIESIYSMEGDYPPLEKLIEVCREHQAELIIDEAHTTGWAGPDGRGWAVEQQLEHGFLARVHTFGKGMGVHGACVVGSEELVHYMINFARPFIYTTAMPAHQIISIKNAISFLERQSDQASILRKRITYYLKQAEGLIVEKSLNTGSPIQWIMTSSGNQHTIDKSSYLQSRGFDVRPILSPTVPRGKERLRICIHAFNTEKQIIDLVTAISSRS